METGKFRAWLGQPTTIKGLMYAVGGAAYGVLTGHWEIGAPFVAAGAVGVVLNETPAQALAEMAQLVGQARATVNEAGAVVGEAAELAGKVAQAQPPAGRVPLGLAAAIGLSAMLGLSSCAALVPAASAIGTAASVYSAVDRGTEAAAKIVAKGCDEYRQVRAAADGAIALLPVKAQAEAVAIEQFGDSGCAAPPAGDPLEFALWTAKVGGQLAAAVAPR